MRKRITILLAASLFMIWGVSALAVSFEDAFALRTKANVKQEETSLAPSATPSTRMGSVEAFGTKDGAVVFKSLQGELLNFKVSNSPVIIKPLIAEYQGIPVVVTGNKEGEIILLTNFTQPQPDCYRLKLGAVGELLPTEAGFDIRIGSNQIRIMFSQLFDVKGDLLALKDAKRS